MKCPACDFSNPPSMRFCGQCGRPLTAAGDDAGAERRQLTVLYCDLVGSTALSERLDPEALAEILRDYRQAATEIVERFDGHVAQVQGDGLLIYLGYPRAHEDDARRAVQAGLGIAEAVAGLSERLAGEGRPRISVRVGVHTGYVVAGEIGTGSGKNLALGPTPSIAARLQASAEPGTVVVSAETRDLVRGFFELDPVGTRDSEGGSRPMEAFRALGETGVADRFTATLGRGLTPLVGRRGEMDLLVRCFESSRRSDGLVVHVSGEAGIGKSRLVHDLNGRVRPVAGDWWSCRGTPLTLNSAFAPLIRLAQKLFLFAAGDSTARKVEKLEEGLERRGLASSAAVPLLAGFLSLPANGDDPPQGMASPRQKERVFELLLSILLPGPAEPPVVIVMEDLHWVDPSTLDFLDLLLERTEGRPALTLLTSRPSFEPTWAARPWLTHLRLGRLSRAQSESLMVDLAGGRKVPAEVLRRVVDQTDGVPLYIEEVTHNLMESGLLTAERDHYAIKKPLATLAIPFTLRDSLTARLDRMGQATKEVAQLASAVGRTFRYEVLAAISTLSADMLAREVGRLVDAGLVFQSAASSQVYVFKHALIRDAAHDSLLKSKRRDIHEKIARLVEDRFSAYAARKPEVLARHFEEARNLEKALDYRIRAGRFAIDRSAYVEAVSHFTKALEHVEGLPESRRRRERELAVRSSLGPALIATKGYAAEDVGASFDRALELAEELGDTPLPVLWGIWLFHFTRGNREATSRLTAHLARLSDKDPAHLFLGQTAQGMTAVFDGGDMLDARRHFETAVGLFASVRRELVAQKLMDAGLLAHQYDVWSLVFVGQPERAWRGQMETLAMAEELGDPFVLSSVLTFAVSTAFELRDTRAVRELARRCIDLAAEQGFPHWLAVARCAHGWAMIREGSDVDPAAVLDSLSDLESSGARQPYWLSFAIDALLRLGKKARGLAFVERALAMAGTGRGSFYEGELLRLQGELHLLAEADEPAAEKYFQKALAVTRRQRAKLWELRAATSHYRLLRRRGRAREAREALQGIYDSFDEGFDIEDLREARGLLAEASE